MHVLTCPVCQGAMKEIDKHGVLIDTCTQCRGVWLDRGELEKLADVLTPPRGSSFVSGGSLPSRGDDRRRRGDDDDDDGDDERRDGWRKDRGSGSRPRRSRFLDFFD